MNWDKYPVPHPQTAARIADGEAIIVLADAGLVHVLNAVGTRIWELVDGVHSVRAIAAILVSEYQVATFEAQQDVETFLASLAEMKMIVFEDRPSCLTPEAN